MLRSASVAIGIVTLFLAAGCGSSPMDTPDSGDGHDGGGHDDTGTDVDAATDVDTGTDVDAGPDVDAAPDVDANLMPCADTPTLADLQPIFDTSCSAVAGCHSSTNPRPSGGLVLTPSVRRTDLVGARSAVVFGQTRVIAGDPMASFLFRKLTNDLGDPRMWGEPMPERPGFSWMSLPPEQIELVRCWIAGGAP